MKNPIIIALIIPILGACGGKSSRDAELSKDLFSYWQQMETETPLDLRGGAFGIDLELLIDVDSFRSCACTARITGNQSRGDYSISTCSDVASIDDAACEALEQSGHYEKSFDQLEICSDEPPGCSNYMWVR